MLAVVALLATGCTGNEAANVGRPAAAAEAAPPASVGSGAVGAARQGDGLTVTIDALRTTDESGMVDLDPSTAMIDTEELRPGQEFLVLGVTIANIGHTAAEYNGLSWSATDVVSGARYGAALLAITGFDLVAGDLAPGESVSGEVSLVIPTDTTTLLVSYDTRLFDQGAALSWDVTIR
jgi:hypothetical protein